MSKSSTSKEKMQLQSVKQTASCFRSCISDVKFVIVISMSLFSHENQGSPPSLSVKCDLIHCMDKLGCSVESPKPTVLILDGAVCVQMLKLLFCKTFQEYSEKVFLPYIQVSRKRSESRFGVGRIQP